MKNKANLLQSPLTFYDYYPVCDFYVKACPLFLIKSGYVPICRFINTCEDFPGGSDGKASAYNADQVRSLGWEDPLEKEMATHSRILAREILWTEEPGRLQSMGLQRVGHD